MSDNEENAPQDESDEDIYKDISDFNFENVLAKLEGSNEAHRQEASDLAEKVKQLTEENEELRKLNDVLGKNLSTLLKTAQNEVKRKDSVIEELRVQLDSFIFRKNIKKTKDKSTSTKDLKYEYDLKSISKNCKHEKNSCSNTSKSFSEKIDSFNENKYNNKTKNYVNSQDENTFCDNGKHLSYKNSFSKAREKDGNARDAMKSSSKHDYYEKEKFSSRSYDNQKRPRSRNYKSGRDHHRKRSFRRRRYSRRFHSMSRSRSLSKSPSSSPSRHRLKNSKEPSFEKKKVSISPSRSPSRRRSKNSKESSFEKLRTSKSPNQNKNQKIKSKSKSKSSNKISDLKFHNHISETNEDLDQNERHKVKMIKDSEKDSKVKENILLGKTEKEQLFNFQNKNSSLDAFYNEIISQVNCNSIPNIENFKSKSKKLQETEKHENYSKFDIEKEDWTLSFKNERQNYDKPMSIYSLRMLKKLNLNPETKNNDESAIKNSSASEKIKTFQKDQKVSETQLSEKEPGELTEDENEVESSKEFQTLTKIASLENSLFEKTTLQNDGSKGKNNLCKKKNYKKVEDEIKVESASNESNKKQEEISENKISDFKKDLNSSKEIQGLVEFSPFKNNYKLIEISPLKPAEDLKNKRLPINPYAQNSVESTTFKLLSTLSGIPLYKNSKPKTEQCNKEPINTIINGFDIPEKENKSNIDKPNKGNEIEGENITVENNSKSKIAKNRKETKIQENKKKFSPQKKLNKKNEEEIIIPKIAKDSNVEKDISKNTEKDVTSLNTIQSTMLSESFLPNPEKESNKFDPDVIEKKNLNFCETKDKFPKDELSDFSSFKKGNNSALKAKVTNSKNKKETSPKLKEQSADAQALTSNEVCESNESNSTKHKNKGENFFKSLKNETQSNSKTVKNKENNHEILKQKSVLKNENKKEIKEKTFKRKRKLNEEPKVEKTNEGQDEPIFKRLRSHKDMKNERNSSNKEIKEDISFFEFFKPIEKNGKANNRTETEEALNPTDFKMTTTMSVTNVVCLETPNKSIEKYKNFMINEQTIYQVLDSKGNFSPCISNCTEMTPRRLLKNDLMLTDSEDDSAAKITQKTKSEEKNKNDVVDDDNDYVDGDDVVSDEMSENNDCESDSDSGASIFVDLL